jgi:MarR family transcriptional regulator, organic hydroperoxide resistance regulator
VTTADATDPLPDGGPVEGVATVEDPLALDRQVCFALAVAARNVIALYRPALEPLGLTHPQYLVMLALWQHGRLSVKELGGLLQLDSGTLSPLLKRLSTAGLVDKERRPEDERSVVVVLTPAGRALRRRAEQVPHEVVDHLGLEQDQLVALHQALAPVIEATRRLAT